jgi:hypothetical protein
MYPSQHLFLGLIFSFLVLLLIPQIQLLGFSIILLSSIFIDIDHYFYYIIKKRDFHIGRAYMWFNYKTKKMLSLSPQKRRDYYAGFYLLHGLELIFLLFFIGVFLSPIFLFITTGFTFHLFLDTISDHSFQANSYKSSIFLNLIKSRSLKSFGNV